MSYIYGKNTVLEILHSEKEVFEVLVTKQFKDNKVFSLCKQKRIPFSVVDIAVIEKKVGHVNHQGIAAKVEDYKYYEVDEILDGIADDHQPLLLMLDGLEDPHNLGAILRTCDAVGVDGVIIGKNRSVQLNGTVAKVSTGAIEHVKVAQVTNLARTIEALQKKGFWVVGCDNDQSVDYRKVDYNMPTVIVIGSEGFGISRLVKDKCDYHVVIPMVGHVTSLNASVATAVILYQVYNSRFPCK